MTEDFPWGEVVKLHKIDGLPDITQYIVSDFFETAGQTSFNVTFPSGMSCSYDTLDEALLGALCDKHGSEDSLPYVIRLVYSDTMRKSEVAERIYDLLPGDDQQAAKEGRALP